MIKVRKQTLCWSGWLLPCGRNAHSTFCEFVADEAETKEVASGSRCDKRPPVCRHIYMKTIVLLRQARDRDRKSSAQTYKMRETEREKGVFRRQHAQLSHPPRFFTPREVARYVS